MRQGRLFVLVAVIVGGLAAAGVGLDLGVIRFPTASRPEHRGIPVRGSLPHRSGTGLPSGWALCTNSALGFSIGYPRDWYTEYRFPDQACRWFDPFRFRLIAETDAFLTALEAHPEQVPFAAAAFENRAGQQVVFWEQTVVNGRQGVRFEMESTDVSVYPEGTRIYRYVVDLGEKGVFVVETRSRPGIDFGAAKGVVDEVVHTLQLL
jgi:hypothetical protein